ncbi:unnamed protein product [Leptidea sinapis]|uniref:C2H2-type domain-containing protein n=1 Tax=Leptidea sinapis TaxID=189913 RepID=A0A5E4R2H9_9NEOP|nr:unnamed protein product [Leptidea sinapis]
MFTTNTVQAGTVPTLQYQEHPTQKSLGKNIENVQQKNNQQAQQTQQEFPTFCYTTNVNMIGKIGATTANNPGGVPASVNIAQLTTSDDKTCYLAQPFSYNYALVNQMQLAPNGIQNTISNISFKCDVCGLMFGHLALLNAHKRIHAQDTENNITVVATGVSSANDVGMPPHIQILSSDPNEQQQLAVQVQDTCITCGNDIPNNPKRKGPKLIRCEKCIEQVSNFKIMLLVPGHHPVKKRNLASVTKCTNCNGSGIIFVGGNKNKNYIQNPDKAYHCNICGGSFSRYSSLWSHKKLHSGEKNYKCGICGIAFAKAM